MIRATIRVGQDLRVVASRATGVELEGEVRLRPGHDVNIHLEGSSSGAAGRPALVTAWRVVRISGEQVTFRGFCEWR